MAGSKPVRFDEQGNLVAIGDMPVNDDTGKLDEQGKATGTITPQTDSNVMADQQTAIVDTPAPVEVKTVSANKLLEFVKANRRGHTTDATGRVLKECNCNQRALAIALLYICADASGEPYGKGQGKSLASRIMAKCFAWSKHKQDILARELTPSGMPRYVAWALGDTKDAPRHRKGGDLYDKKGGVGELLASGEAQYWFDAFAASEGYVANK